MKRSQLARGKPLKQGGRLTARSPMKRGKRIRVKADPEMAVWSLAVRMRNENKCQWPGVLILKAPFGMSPQFAARPCATGDTRIDPHHIAKRSQRPDLKYDVSNGICLCRTHHEWTDEEPELARQIGLLSTESYELARKGNPGLRRNKSA